MILYFLSAVTVPSVLRLNVYMLLR